MPHNTYNAVSNTENLRDTWDAEIGLNPTEETKIADWVEQPVGAQKFGNNLYLRKLPALSANAYTPSTTAALRGSLTWNTASETRVTVAAVGRYSAVGLERAILNRVIDDGNLRSGYKTQLMASLKEALDTAIFTLAASLSATETGVDIDDAMLRSGLGQLVLNAKGKIKDGTEKLLVVHPSEFKNALGIAAIKEYQIRGTVGSAVNGRLNAYGVMWRESGLVFASAGTAYQPLIIKDAFALAFNEKPHILDVQFDGLSENFIGYEEFGTSVWFDSSGVSLNVTVP